VLSNDVLEFQEDSSRIILNDKVVRIHSVTIEAVDCCALYRVGFAHICIYMPMESNLTLMLWEQKRPSSGHAAA
jgi:hypothetical protein